MGSRVIDMRSDTVTRPTAGMRRAMAEAECGDDMNGEDPTVNALEARFCELLGKEAAVYACSGTQSNQMAVRAHCQSGDELLIDETGHIASYEQGGPAVLSGVTCRTIRGNRGILDVTDLLGKIRPDNQHYCRTRLICLENTANLAGGRVYPQEKLDGIGVWAHGQGLKVHLDGARLFNAVVASGTSALRMCQQIDTVSICFSKGLGCPMGSILVGSREEIYHARRARKLFGGALRQAGIPAAAALYALDHHVERLADDHALAKEFAQRIAEIPGVTLSPPDVQTNLVFFEIDPKWGTGAQLVAMLRSKGVLMNVSGGPQRLRACTHLDVSRDAALEAAHTIQACLSGEKVAVAMSGASGPYAN